MRSLFCFHVRRIEAETGIVWSGGVVGGRVVEWGEGGVVEWGVGVVEWGGIFTPLLPKTFTCKHEKCILNFRLDYGDE